MSTDHLGTALRDLVDDAERGLTPPAPEQLWAGGRRRRRTAALVPALAAACVAALVALLGWTGGQPRASVPAVGVDGSSWVRVASHPAAIPLPPFPTSTGRPGVTSAVVTAFGDDASHQYAVSTEGTVTRLVLAGAGSPDGRPAVSPDGRWLARGPVLTDLVRGDTVPSSPVRQGLASARMPTEQPAWWSPDSRRVYVDAVDLGRPTSSGFVVATDGTVTSAPLLAGGQVPVVAGWLDGDTVLAFVQLGPADAPRLEGRTWRVGAGAWKISGPDLELSPPGGEDGGGGAGALGPLAASLSPDRSRVLVTSGVVDLATNQVDSTRGALFDARTGAQVGFRAPGGLVASGSRVASFDSLTWDGFGCRPAWSGDEPVITDRAVRSTTLGIPERVVDVSSRYDSPCVGFAGDELRGAPVVDTAQVWQERLWVWGGRLLIALSLVALVWWFARRRSWRPGSEPAPPVTPVRG